MAIGIDHIKAAADTSEALAPADLNNLLILIQGEKQVGKSTFVTRFLNPFVIDLEWRLDSIVKPDGKRPAQQKVATWDELMEWTDAFIGTTPEQTGINTFIVDGAGVAYRMLGEKLMKGLKAQTLNDEELGYAKGWIRAAELYTVWFMKLRQLKASGYGVILTTHDRIVPFTNNNVEMDKRVPLIANDKDEKYGWTAIRPFPDMVIYAHKVRTKNGIIHMAQLRGSDIVEAGCPTPPSGIQLPDIIPFTYDELRKAWDRTEVPK